MSSNVSMYVDYFRQIAVKHSALQHDPDTETGDGDPGRKRFTRWNADEVVTGLVSKVAFPALLVELYEVQTKSESVYEVRQLPRGAITVLASGAPENFTKEAAAYDLAEGIMYQVLQKMWKDHYGAGVNRCTTPFKDIDFSRINITPVPPIFNYQVGYRAEFEFTLQDTIDIATPPADGIFLP